jgi:hypothetical protein
MLRGKQKPQINENYCETEKTVSEMVNFMSFKYRISGFHLFFTLYHQKFLKTVLFHMK